MFPALPAATRTLILINVVVFLLELVPGVGDALVYWFALWPLRSAQFWPWQLISYAFLHGNWQHIFFNMFAVFVFGAALENYWGARRFVMYYLVCVVSAALTQLVVQSFGGPAEEVIGASGGVFGLLLAFAWYFPQQRIILLLLPIPLPAWLFVSGYAVVELFFGVTGRQAGVAHFAHLGGMLGGMLCILYWNATGVSGRRFSR